MVLHKTDADRLGILSIYEIKEGMEAKMGEGRITLTEAKPDKKLSLMDATQELIGEAYIDCIQEYTDGSEMKSSSLPNYLHKIQATSHTPIKNTSSSVRTNHFKKISVISPNQSIIFSTSQRFKPNNNPE